LGSTLSSSLHRHPLAGRNMALRASLLGGAALLALLAIFVGFWQLEEQNVDQPVAAQNCGCPVGNVSDCCCSYSDLEETNDVRVHSLLKEVVGTPFFAHFRVNLCSECALWQDPGLCVLRDCAVCECESAPAWAVECEQEGQSGEPATSQVDQNVVPLPAFAVGAESSWGQGDQATSQEEVVVDLRENPERYTGYSGSSAARVWDEVHNRNCFNAELESSENRTSSMFCPVSAVQRVYDRLLSGLHSSISLHIAHGYCLERSALVVGECARWGPNASLARERVLDHRSRVENLYAAFAVLLRAVVRAGEAVSVAVPKGDEAFAEGLQVWEEQLLPELVQLAATCPKTFAEDEIFSGPGVAVVRGEVERRLEQLAEIMKCVGCDRCKLWGTLQTQGLGVALKVLFQPDDIKLTRQEAVALVHTLERLSSSLQYLRDFRSQA